MLRSLITPSLKNIASQVPFNEFADNADNITPEIFSQIIDDHGREIRNMLIKAKQESEEFLITKKINAEKETRRILDAEIERLESLMKVNLTVRSEELDYLKTTKANALNAVKNATMRLEATRLIVVVS